MPDTDRLDAPTRENALDRHADLGRRCSLALVVARHFALFLELPAAFSRTRAHRRSQTVLAKPPGRV